MNSVRLVHYTTYKVSAALRPHKLRYTVTNSPCNLSLRRYTPTVSLRIPSHGSHATSLFSNSSYLQVELENTKKAFIRDHIVTWLEGEVIASITPDQEEANINQCIASLSLLAPQ